MAQFMVEFVDLLLTVLSLAIFGRVLLSWLSPGGGDPISAFLIQITEPILAPIRRYMPRTGMWDLTPMVALALLNFVVRPVVDRLIAGAY